MTDENPYSPPKSYLGSFGSTRHAVIIVLAAVIVLAIVGAGLIEALRHPSKNLRFGVSYPLAILYSGSLSLALGICALAIFRWKRTDLFASNTGRQFGSDVD